MTVLVRKWIVTARVVAFIYLLWIATVAAAAQGIADREVLNVDEAAALLRVDPSNIVELADRGAIPARRVGNTWRFLRSALFDWLAGDEHAKRPQHASRNAIGDLPPAEDVQGELRNLTARGITEPPAQASAQEPAPKEAATGSTHRYPMVLSFSEDPPDAADNAAADPPASSPASSSSAAGTPASSSPTAGTPAVGERPTQPSTEDIALRDQRVLLPRGAGTIDFGMAYGRSSRSLLPVMRVEQSDFYIDSTVRYGIMNNVQLTLRAPAVWRNTKTFTDASVTGTKLPGKFTLPDNMAQGASVSVLGVGWRESARLPTMIWSFDSTLPLGPGDRGIGGGMVLSKSYDPAVLFAGFTYLYGQRFAPADPNSSLGKHNYGVQVGYTYAVNDTLALNTSLFGTYRDTRSPDGSAIPPPRQNYSLQLGTTWLLAKGLFVEPGVAMQLGGDTPGLTLMLNFSRSFAAQTTR